VCVLCAVDVAGAAVGIGRLSLSQGAGNGQLRGHDSQRRSVLRYVGLNTRPPHVENKQGD